MADAESVRSDIARDYEAFRALVTSLQAQLPRRLLQVAEFALRHPEEMALGTAASLAARAQVQPSTMVRFAQALGYQGFSDLQDVFKARIRDRWPEPPERLRRLKSSPGGSPASDLDGFIAAAQTSLARLHETMPASAIGHATRLLSRAQTVYIVGTRRSFPIVDYLGYTFATLGVRALPIDSMSGLAREQAALAEPGDAMLAVSFTPYAPATAELAGAAVRREVPLIAITDSPLAPLAQIARVAIEIVEADYAGFRSLAASFVVANALTAATAARRQAVTSAAGRQGRRAGRFRSRHRPGSAP
ncbi:MULTISPECIES: MurR/RpiR family transcriptional regulator [Rhodomicrobium]|uniref:MurR/RpiR family transcriptional regulator n=1 Tax=Rhodomicrobium TaxID=1068 RepID=UPI000B4B3CBE|nr:MULTISPECIES: MurR/RpiR family transcriptional regulator [Rhodomicrobium]